MAITSALGSSAELAAISTADVQTKTTTNDTAAPAASDSNFGAAVSVTLSPAAQAIVNNAGPTASTAPAAVAATSAAPSAAPTSAVSPASSTSASSSAAPSSAPAKPAGGGGAPPISVTSLLDDATAAKRKIIPEVGVVGANEVVDSKGNIDHITLAKLEAQQVAAQSS